MPRAPAALVELGASSLSPFAVSNIRVLMAKPQAGMLNSYALTAPSSAKDTNCHSDSEIQQLA